MNGNKENKEGLSVKEIEGFAKKHRLEVFFCLFFFLAGIFGLLLWSPGWSVCLGAVGAIIGALIPAKLRQLSHSLMGFVFRQDRNTQIILAAIALVLAIFVSPLVFLLIGLHAGESMRMAATDASSQK